MIFLISGEGKGDLGSCVKETNACSGEDLIAGPMLSIADKLIEPVWGYSPLGASSFVLVPKPELGRASKQLKAIALPGDKSAQETAYFRKNARALAKKAIEWQTRDGCPVGAILFRDSDGTHSSPNTMHDDKVRSMERGFEAEGFRLGVPMIPKPKSEGWLICLAGAQASENCASLEERSGNDASENALKAMLAETLVATGRNHQSLMDDINAGKLDPNRISMPSFAQFKARLVKVASALLRTGLTAP